MIQGLFQSQLVGQISCGRNLKVPVFESRLMRNGEAMLLDQGRLETILMKLTGDSQPIFGHGTSETILCEIDEAIVNEAFRLMVEEKSLVFFGGPADTVPCDTGDIKYCRAIASTSAKESASIGSGFQGPGSRTPTPPPSVGSLGGLGGSVIGTSTPGGCSKTTSPFELLQNLDPPPNCC